MNMEGRGHSLFEHIITARYWIGWGKKTQTSVNNVCVPDKIRTRHLTNKSDMLPLETTCSVTVYQY